MTIITVVFNAEKYLAEAIQSVLNQEADNIEYIVIDGKSTDRSVDIIKKFDSSINRWISEPDKGIYDAINKGITISSGEIIGILNADDILNAGVIKHISEAFQKNEMVDYVYGYVERMTKNGVVYDKAHSLSQNQMETHKFRQIPIPHGALFVKKKVFDELGYYRTDYKINSDYDFILKLIENEKKGLQLDLAVSKYRDGGRSSGFLTFWERRTLLKRYGVPWLRREWIVYKAMTKLLFAKLLSKGFSLFLNK